MLLDSTPADSIILIIKNRQKKFFTNLCLRLGKREPKSRMEVVMPRKISNNKAPFLTKISCGPAKQLRGKGGEPQAHQTFPCLKLHLELGLCKMRVTRASPKGFSQSLLFTLLSPGRSEIQGGRQVAFSEVSKERRLFLVNTVSRYHCV